MRDLQSNDEDQIQDELMHVVKALLLAELAVFERSFDLTLWLIVAKITSRVQRTAARPAQNSNTAVRLLLVAIAVTSFSEGANKGCWLFLSKGNSST